MWQASVHAALTLFAALNILDIASTALGLRAGLVEANGFPAMLMARGGEAAMYMVKGTIALLCIAVVMRLSRYYRRLRYGIQIANWFLAVAVFLNLFQILAI